MSERVVENEWREQAFDQPVMAAPKSVDFGFEAFDREMDALGQDINGLARLVAERTQRVGQLRRQVAEIANGMVR